MNPLKKVILGVLIGTVIGLLAAGNDVKSIPMLILGCTFYAIGLIFGGQIVARWTGKALKLGTDLTFWLLFVLLFRRGFFWGFIVFSLIVSFTFGIGCYIGIGKAIIEMCRYIFGNKDSWKKKKYFPFTDADAYALLLVWFAKYNEQNFTEDDIAAVLRLVPGSDINSEAVDIALSNNRLDQLYRSIEIYRNNVKNESGNGSSILLLSRLLNMVADSEKITYHGMEFLLLIGEICGFSQIQIEEAYERTTGKEFPHITNSIDPNFSLA